MCRSTLRSAARLLFLAGFLACLPAPALAGTVTLAWDPNSESDLAGYIVLYGTQAGVYTTSLDVGNRTNSSIASLEGGRRYYFVVQAYNTSGLTSPYSDEVNAYIELPSQPAIGSVTPASGLIAGGTAITITGSNFQPGASVWLGITRTASAVVVNSTTMTAVSAAAPAGGAVDVRVTNPDGGTAIKPLGFTYVDPRISVTSVSPGAGGTAGGTAVTITGTNFAGGAVARFGDRTAASTTVLSGTTIVAVTPPSAAGTVAVNVTNTDGASASLANAFTYVTGLPTLVSVQPWEGPPSGGTLITLTGSNFTSGMTLTVGGAAATDVTVTSATSLTARTPALAPGAAAPLAVDLVLTGPGGSATMKKGFTYVTPVPAITAVTPASGSSAGGTRVTITGGNFSPSMQVFFGGEVGTSVAVHDASTLSVTTPAHAAGVVSVGVKPLGGTLVERASAFTFLDDDHTVDSDRDGLPDWWETQFGLDPARSTDVDGATGDPDGDGLTNAQEHAAGTHPRGFHARYFAEGVNSTLFDTTFDFLNPSAHDAHLLLTFQRQAGGVVRKVVRIAAQSRASVGTQGVAGLENDSFSMVFESDVELVAERTVSWDRRGYGAHSETAIAGASPTWYLAEGATHSGFDLYYLIQNPSAAWLMVRVTYLLPSGSPIVKHYNIAPSSRYTVWVDVEDPRLAQTDVSAIVTSLTGQSIIVERAMYREGRSQKFTAGHAAAGVTTPSSTWFLAEGSTGPLFDLYVLIANPETRAVDALVSFLLPDGTTIDKVYRVPGLSRYTIYVDEADPRLVHTAVSTTVRTLDGAPIIVERAMWWPGRFTQWFEAHASAGSTRSARRWAVAGGEEGGARNVTTYYLMANTSPVADDVKVTVLYEDGSQSTRTFSLPANSRFNVHMRAQFPESAGRKFGVVVESLGRYGVPAELVVERAIYWDADVAWAAGTNAPGMPVGQ